MQLVDEQGSVDQILKDVLDGKQRVLSHPESQYQFTTSNDSSVSACGLAALNCARTIFQWLESNSPGEGEAGDPDDGRHVLSSLLSKQTAEDILSICSLWTSSSHLEVDDLLELPVFKNSFRLAKTIYGQTNSGAGFASLLRDMVKVKSHITNGPIATVITRPPEIIVCMRIVLCSVDVFVIFDSHPRPSHPSGCGFILDTSLERAAKYLDGLLSIDATILDDPSIHWQAQLLGHFSGHILVPPDPPCVATHLDDVLFEATFTILQLKADLANLRQHQAITLAKNRTLSMKITQLETALSPKGKGIANDNIPSSFASGPSSLEGSGSSTAHSLGRAIRGPRNAGHKSDLNSEVAVALQRQYDEEDRRLIEERSALMRANQTFFNCGICLDTVQLDHIARFDHCRHAFCRQCLRRHVRSVLEERRYPIFCPACVASNAQEPSSVDDGLFFCLGFPDPEDLKIYQDLQLAAHSIAVHCRRCKQTMFVDRNEYQTTNLIVCPLPRCNYVWCKNCQLAIDVSGPQHSCDGSSELKHLMKTKGWRHCPGCETPIQKESGCNHMTVSPISRCPSSGCNTHFCYVCGKKIIQSLVRLEIKSATSAHYRKCVLFETYGA